MSIIKKNTRKVVAVIAAAFVILGLGLSLCANVNAAVKGGIAPPSDEIDGAVRGGTYNASERVINSGDEIGTFNLSLEGECTDWVTLYDAENMTRGEITNISVANLWYAPVLVVYEIPEDVANGNYTATVVVESTLTGETGGGVAAALGRWLYNVRKPGCNGTISVLYNTTGMEPGNYLANVTVSLIDATIAAVGNVTVGNVTLATEELPFTLSAAAAGEG